MQKKRGLLPKDDEGEITISFRENGMSGRARIVRKVVIENPTEEKIGRALRTLWRSGFKGNVHLRLGLTDPFTIVTEEFRTLDSKALNEVLSGKK